MSNSAATSGRSQLSLETLEACEVPTLIVPPKTVPPDHAGGTFATAAVVSVPEMGQVTQSDYLPSASDIDFYKVHLTAGDFLSAGLKSTGTAALNGSLAVFDSGNHLITQSPSNAGKASVLAPSVGFYAASDGDYFIRATTSGAGAGVTRRYDLNVDRIGLIDTAAPATLAQAGAYHAWLNQAGDTLNISGPSGYGFSLKSNWSPSTSGNTETYTASGKITLQTAALGDANSIVLQVPSGQKFSVSTQFSGQVQLGELSKITGSFGLSLAPVAGVIKDTFGLDVSSQSVLNGWTIMTGKDIKQKYQSVTSHDLGQMLDGVPYLVYGKAGSLNVHFGDISLTTTNQASTVLIADPADPFLYVAYKNYAAAGSVHGRIPFETTLVTPDDQPAIGGPAIGEHTEFYGQVFAAGSFPIAGLPMTVDGDVTVNLDANHDGQYLGGAGNASQLFHGDLGAIDNVLKDINVGVNGSVNLGYSVAGVKVSVPVGQASAYYSGQDQAFFFEGKQGTALNHQLPVSPWANTILKNFQVGQGAAIEGYVYRDGRFSVSTSTNYQFFFANAALTLTVTNQDISASGTLSAPIFNSSVEVGGSIGFNGDFSWSGHAQVNIGGALSGSADFTLTKNSSGATLNAGLNNGLLNLSTNGYGLKGHANGSLKVHVDSSGHVSYDIGSLWLEADLYFAGAKVGEADLTVTLNGKHVKVHAHAGPYSVTFGFDLP